MLYDSIVDIIGKYEPIVVSGSAVDGSGGSIAYVDFTYVFAGTLFCIVVMSLFKILGGVIRGRHA